MIFLASLGTVLWSLDLMLLYGVPHYERMPREVLPTKSTEEFIVIFGYIAFAFISTFIVVKLE